MTVKQQHFSLSDHGTVLATRRAGKEVARHLAELVDGPCDLVLDFAGVEALTPPFIDELLGQLDVIFRRDGDAAGLVLATNLEPDAKETLQMVLAHGKRGLVYQDKGEAELLSDSPHLVETLRAARELSRFTAPDLAQRLAISLPNANQRLVALMESHAVSRERDLSADRGVRYSYRADLAISGRR